MAPLSGSVNVFPHVLQTYLILWQIRTSVFSMSDLSLISATYLLWMMQDADPQARHSGSFLASHAS